MKLNFLSKRNFNQDIANELKNIIGMQVKPKQKPSIKTAENYTSKFNDPSYVFAESKIIQEYRAKAQYQVLETNSTTKWKKIKDYNSIPFYYDSVKFLVIMILVLFTFYPYTFKLIYFNNEYLSIDKKPRKLEE